MNEDPPARTYTPPPTLLADHGDDLVAVIDALNAGDLAMFATETLWSLSCLADDVAAIARLRAAKSRPADMPLAVGFATVAAAKEYVEWTPWAERLRTHLPGPLSLVLPRKDERLAAAAPGRDSLSIRIPDHPIAHAVLQACGPLVMTSANGHGEPDPRTRAEATAAMPGLPVVGAAVPGTGSTIVDVCSEPRILRQGGLVLEFSQ